MSETEQNAGAVHLPVQGCQMAVLKHLSVQQQITMWLQKEGELMVQTLRLKAEPTTAAGHSHIHGQGIQPPEVIQDLHQVYLLHRV